MSTTTDRGERTRRGKALLAGGLVLGLGAAATLAAFTDDVFASGTFTSSKFSLQGSTSTLPAAAPSFKDYPGPNGGGDGSTYASLSFASTALAPGDTVYAPFSVRTGAGSSAGNVKLAGAYVSAPGTLDPYLSYKVFLATATTCDAATFGSAAAWSAGKAGGTATAPTAPTTDGAAQTLAANQGGTTAFCIAVTLDGSQAAKDAINSAASVTPTTVTWDFRGTATA